MVPDKDGNALLYFESVETDDIIRGIDEADIWSIREDQGGSYGTRREVMQETLDPEALKLVALNVEKIENAMALGTQQAVRHSSFLR